MRGFDNDVRSERMLAGMKAALSLGRWTFQAPLGYLNAPKWSTSSLVHDPVRRLHLATPRAAVGVKDPKAEGTHSIKDSNSIRPVRYS